MNIGNSWDSVLKNVFASEGFNRFFAKIEKEYAEKTIYPKKEDIFNALKLTSFEDVKVVIIGQDPYIHGGEAHGLSFSVQKDVKIPPSLRNIYKELNSDLGIPEHNDGDLTYWAKQGVLLLNSVLTVREGQANSHQGLGWERLTDYIIKTLNKREKPIVFILWGNNAKEKAKLITNMNHLVITSAHPSPLSANRGFFGSKPFSKTNDFLKAKGITAIDWDLENK